MAIIDDLKKKTEEGLKALKETAQDIAFNVEKQAKIGKMKYLDITKLRRQIQKTYAEMGEFVYDQFSSGKDVKKDDSFLEQRMAAISRMILEIDDIEREISEINKTQPPKHGEE
jgi:hypothetical protein